MVEGGGTLAGYNQLAREVATLRRIVVVLGVALLISTSWLAVRAPILPPVLTAERLDIVEANGNFAFVLANSQRPVGATMNGKVLLGDQEEERRGVPSFIFFDGKGDEVGGFTLGVRTNEDGYSATRHLSLDGYKQDQTVVLAHYQSEDGASAGLRISDRPLDRSMIDALSELGLEPGPSREELQAAVQALPEETRAERLQELFGVQRVFLGSSPDRSASLILRDTAGRPRIVVSVSQEGEPTIRVLDETGNAVLELPTP